MSSSTSTSTSTPTSPPSLPTTFTAHVRTHLSRHRQDWTRHYGPLIETLRQRGLLARLDALSRPPSPAHAHPSPAPARETLSCLAATAHALSEWALKLPGRERGAVARGAVAVVDGFGAAALARCDQVPLRPLRARARGGGGSASNCCCCCCGDGGAGAGLSAAELAGFGAKVRAARAVLARVLREGGEGVLGGLLGWVYRAHARWTVEVVLARVVEGRLPGELVELVREGLLERGGERLVGVGEGIGGMRQTGARDEDGRVERRVLAPAGVGWLEIHPAHAVVA